MRILFIVTEDWTFVSHRLHLAEAAMAQGHQVALLCNVSTCAEQIKRAGITLIPWNLNRRSLNLLLELKAIAMLHGAFRQYRPDLIHAVALKPVLYASLASLFFRRTGLVFALGGLGFIFSSSRRRARLARPLLALAYRLALARRHCRLILQNPDDARMLLDARAVDAARVSIVRGAGVETDRFAPQPFLPGLPLVVLPARMLWDKGIGEFVAAATQLRDRGIEARFALVGDRDEFNPECVSAAQLAQWVDLGVVEWWGRRDDMPQVLAAAHIVCLPSYREGLPKALLEAASCARPIVTFDVPGCREAVCDGENGFLVPFGVVAGLAERLGQLIHNPALRASMGAAGRLKAIREFSSERVAVETTAVWQTSMNLAQRN